MNKKSKEDERKRNNRNRGIRKPLEFYRETKETIDQINNNVAMQTRYNKGLKGNGIPYQIHKATHTQRTNAKPNTPIQPKPTHNRTRRPQTKNQPTLKLIFNTSLNPKYKISKSKLY